MDGVATILKYRRLGLVWMECGCLFPSLLATQLFNWPEICSKIKSKVLTVHPMYSNLKL